jgi:F0F1-type ATP synthase membrane subunit c/vacuolar-type H+-ATPase subunit K
MYESFAILVGALLLAGTYILAQGGMISASADMENKSTPWGASLTAFGGFSIVVCVLLVFILIFGGGESEMIPESAWPFLTGALTMIGAGFAAALCIMVAVKSGAEMVTEKPELTIWSLLYVALGEGLAIYGLIITILMVGG